IPGIVGTLSSNPDPVGRYRRCKSRGCMSGKDNPKAHWSVIAIVVTAIVALSAAVVWTMPPHTIVMATGAEGGAYYEFGKRYQEALAKAGVQLKLVPTGGSVENLRLLRDRRSGVGVALIQGGTFGADDAQDVESLGTLFYEPLWLFVRGQLASA